MKIAVILPSLANRGPILIAKYLADIWIKQGKTVDIFHFDEEIEVKFGSSINRINFFQPFNFKNYDIIHSHMLRPDMYVALHSKKISKTTKTISTIHQESYKSLKLQYSKFKSFSAWQAWKFSLKFIDHIVALNHTTSRELSHSRISIIGNGIPKCQIAPPDESDIEVITDFKNNFKVILGSSCLLIKRKGIDQIIRVLQRNPDIGYIIIGNGEEKDNLIALSKKLRVNHQCLFLGQKLDGVRYFKYFDVYVLPSHSEGFPICGIEAAMHGKPIVCSNIAVLKEIFKSSEVSFFELNSIDSLEIALKKAVLKKDQYSRKLLAKYQSQLSDKIMAEKYNDLITEITKHS